MHTMERSIPDRHVCNRFRSEIPQNTDLCVENSQALKNHLLVRDVCQASDKIRDRYSAAKLELPPTRLE